MSTLLSQQATSEELVTTAGLSDISSSVKPTPYRSGHPVDKIHLLHTQLPLHIQSKLEDTYRSLVGSLNWLSATTRPDIATITNILTAYLHKSIPSHLAAVKHVIKYIKGTTDLGICFFLHVKRKIWKLLSNFQLIKAKYYLLLTRIGFHKMLQFQNPILPKYC